MADLSKLKAKRLGAPPQPDDASTTLQAPETAPASPPPAVNGAAAHVQISPKRRDMRSARRTGRTVQFATRVTEKFDDEFRAYAERHGLQLAQLLEKTWEVFKQHNRN